MPRGVTTLEQIVANIRLNTGRSSSRNFGISEYDAIRQLAQNHQQLLYNAHDWPFLNVQRDIELQAGERYYDAPDDLNLDRIKSVHVKEGGDWIPLLRGISTEDYSYYDSDNDARADPAEKWDIRLTGDEGDTDAAGEQIEIFPIPETTGRLVRITGVAVLQPFIADDDVCTLDNLLIELFASADLLARDRHPDAQAKLAQANQLLTRQKGNFSKPTPRNAFSMQGGADGSRGRDGSKTIIISSGS